MVQAGRHRARRAGRTRYARRAGRPARASSCSCACAAGRRSRPGATKFPRRRSPQDILRQLAEGRVVLETLTVIEGWTFADMRRAVEAHPQIKSTLRGQDIAASSWPPSAIRANIRKAASSPIPIASRPAPPIVNCYALAYRKMAEALEAAWNARAAALPLDDRL